MSHLDMESFGDLPYISLLNQEILKTIERKYCDVECLQAGLSFLKLFYGLCKQHTYVSVVDNCELVRLLAIYHDCTSESVIEILTSGSKGGTLTVAEISAVIAYWPRYQNANDENENENDDHEDDEYLDELESRFQALRILAGIEVLKMSLTQSRQNEFQEWDSDLYLLQSIFFECANPDDFRIDFALMLSEKFVIGSHYRVIEDEEGCQRYSLSVRHIYDLMSAFPSFIGTEQYMKLMKLKFDKIGNVLLTDNASIRCYVRVPSEYIIPLTMISTDEELLIRFEGPYFVDQFEVCKYFFEHFRDKSSQIYTCLGTFSRAQTLKISFKRPLPGQSSFPKLADINDVRERCGWLFGYWGRYNHDIVAFYGRVSLHIHVVMLEEVGLGHHRPSFSYRKEFVSVEINTTSTIADLKEAILLKAGRDNWVFEKLVAVKSEEDWKQPQMLTRLDEDSRLDERLYEVSRCHSLGARFVFYWRLP